MKSSKIISIRNKGLLPNIKQLKEISIFPMEVDLIHINRNSPSFLVGLEKQ